jgi:hypothetical protein
MTYTPLNKQIVQELSLYISDSRYREKNYYVDDNLLASAALEWVVETLKRRLEESCLNVEGEFCRLWYMDSHEACMTIMKILYSLTNDDLYSPVLQLPEYDQDEVW